MTPLHIIIAIPFAALALTAALLAIVFLVAEHIQAQKKHMPENDKPAIA